MGCVIGGPAFQDPGHQTSEQGGSGGSSKPEAGNCVASHDINQAEDTEDRRGNQEGPNHKIEEAKAIEPFTDQGDEMIDFFLVVHKVYRFKGSGDKCDAIELPDFESFFNS